MRDVLFVSWICSSECMGGRGHIYKGLNLCDSPLLSGFRVRAIKQAGSKQYEEIVLSDSDSDRDPSTGSDKIYPKFPLKLKPGRTRKRRNVGIEELSGER